MPFLPPKKEQRMSKSALALLLLIAALHVSTASADTITYGGTTAGGLTWNRPVANGSFAPVALSGLATAVPYSVQSFTVSLAGLYSLQSTAVPSSGWDNYTFLYMNGFNPASPLANVLRGNDDNPTPGLSGFSINLLAGTTYFFVTTGVLNADFGTFSNTFSGPGAITLGSPSVPESGPGIIAFGLVVSCLGLARLRLFPVTA